MKSNYDEFREPEWSKRNGGYIAGFLGFLGTLSISGFLGGITGLLPGPSDFKESKKSLDNKVQDSTNVSTGKTHSQAYKLSPSEITKYQESLVGKPYEAHHLASNSETNNCIGKKSNYIEKS